MSSHARLASESGSSPASAPVGRPAGDRVSLGPGRRQRVEEGARAVARPRRSHLGRRRARPAPGGSSGPTAQPATSTASSEQRRARGSSGLRRRRRRQRLGGAAPGAAPPPSASPRMTRKKSGMKKIPIVVAKSMPANTPVPSECRLPAPAPLRDHQRRDAEDEGERGHENRPEPLARRLDRGLAQAGAPVPDLVGELHDQDRVLGREPHHRDQADLEVDVARQSRGARCRAARRARRTARRRAPRTESTSSRTAPRAPGRRSPGRGRRPARPARWRRAPGTTGPE